jgi:hypothetical protein
MGGLIKQENQEKKNDGTFLSLPERPVEKL